MCLALRIYTYIIAYIAYYTAIDHFIYTYIWLKLHSITYDILHITFQSHCILISLACAIIRTAFSFFMAAKIAHDKVCFKWILGWAREIRIGMCALSKREITFQYMLARKRKKRYTART